MVRVVCARRTGGTGTLSCVGDKPLDMAHEMSSNTHAMPGTADDGLSPRERILQAATTLLAAGGREAVSTRTVSAAAGVQPPTIYRQFGDMQGLLNTVARDIFAGYVRQKTTREHADDPFEELRRGWDLHVAFGLANPAVYALIYGDPTTAAHAPAARDAAASLSCRRPSSTCYTSGLTGWRAANVRYAPDWLYLYRTTFSCRHTGDAYTNAFPHWRRRKALSPCWGVAG